MNANLAIAPPGRTLDLIFDNRLNQNLVRLLPGDYYVSAHAEITSTVLGSCISACMRDVETGIGGMNHFMLPDTGNVAQASEAGAARYGRFAMEILIDGIVRLGGRRENLEVKLFGGGRIVDGMSDVGQRNIAFVRAYLEQAGLSPVAQDLGMHYPRKINYFTDTGRVMVKKLRSLHSRSIAAEEQQLRRGAESASSSSGSTP